MSAAPVWYGGIGRESGFLDTSLTDLAGGAITLSAPTTGSRPHSRPIRSFSPPTVPARRTATRANSTAGGPYTVSASANGIATPATFSLTNLSGMATISVSDPSGKFTGHPFTAAGTVTGAGNVVISTPALTFAYYLSTDTQFANPMGAPTTVGSYVVVATFAGNSTYAKGTKSASFSITQATPAVVVTDNGGVATGNPFTATATITGVSGSPAATLEGVGATFSYYTGSSASGTALPGDTAAHQIPTPLSPISKAARITRLPTHLQRRSPSASRPSVSSSAWHHPTSLPPAVGAIWVIRISMRLT